MASVSFAPDPVTRRRIPIAETDAAVCARLGPTRGLGNAQPACFNRQISRETCGWLDHQDNRTLLCYYHGRDHSTVCYSIQRMQAMRDHDPDVDALISELWTQLVRERQETADGDGSSRERNERDISTVSIEDLADLIADRVYARLQKRI